MTPVFQRISDQGRGDCFSAALASILDLRYEDVPAFVTEAADFGQLHRWHDALVVWLRILGLRMHEVSWKEFRDWRGLEGAYALLSVPSQRFPKVRHCVVGTWVAEGSAHVLKIAHDPSPWNTPYPPDVEPSYVSFLVPLSPTIRVPLDLQRASEAARAIINAPVNNTLPLTSAPTA